jgi:nucleotide-binding universal stress UspA family protein
MGVMANRNKLIYMKRILVPTDFSNTALQALEFAIEIAPVYKAEITVLHIIELPTNILYNYPFQGDIIKEMKKKAELTYLKWSERFRDKFPDIRFHTEQSVLVSAIKNFIKDQEIDIVVMGTHGASGFSEFFVGSNTEKVVRLSEVPVFSIKKSVSSSSIKNIVFPTQLTLNETELVDRVKELQKHFDAHLHIVYVNTPSNFKKGNEIKALFDDYTEHYGFENHSTITVDDVNEQAGIMELANELPGVLIAMATHKRRGLAHFFVGSIAEDIVNQMEMDCPIWTYSIKK